MTALMALFLGGGFYAYRLGVAPAAQEGSAGVGAGKGSTTVANTTNEAANPLNPSGASQNQDQGRVKTDEAAGQAINAAKTGNVGYGKLLFTSNCAGCHGANAQGVVGPSLVAQGGPADWQFADFRRALWEGIAPNNTKLNATMPRFGRTPLQPKGQVATDQDLADIQAYIKTLQ